MVNNCIKVKRIRGGGKQIILQNRSMDSLTEEGINVKVKVVLLINCR